MHRDVNLGAFFLFALECFYTFALLMIIEV